MLLYLYMQVLSVIPLKKSSFFETLTYFSTEPVDPGMLVTVKLRGKKINALVTDVEDVANVKAAIKNADFALRPIESIEGPLFLRESYTDTIHTIADMYAIKKSVAYTSLTPAQLLTLNDAIATRTQPATRKSTGVASEKLIFQASLDERLSRYRTYIREAFARKESIICILPTTHDVAVWYAELSRGIEEFAFFLHSGLTDKVVETRAKKILEEPHPIVVIATMPFLSLPRHDIGTIIIEHESSSAYRAVTEPHIDLAFAAQHYASRAGIRSIRGDTLLSLETLMRRDTGEYTDLAPPSFRFEGSADIALVVRAEIETVGTWSPFDAKVMHSIEATIARGGRVFLFALRNGLATETKCRDCSLLVSCEYCHAPLVLYRDLETDKRVFICNRCKRHRPSETVCARCGSWNLMLFGIGVDTVYEEAKKLFPAVPLFRIDRDTIKDEKMGQKIAREFSTTKGAILIGTEMALSFLESPVHESIIVSIDSLFGIPSFRIEERIAHIVLDIMSVTERRIIIQTRVETNGIFARLQERNMLTWYKEQREERMMLGFPPYVTILKYRVHGHEAYLKDVKEKIDVALAEFSPDTFRTPSKKVKGEELLNIVIRIGDSRNPEDKETRKEKEARVRSTLTAIAPLGVLFVNPDNLLG